MSFEYRSRHLDLTIGGPEDNTEICRLFREVHVAGELDVNQERDPDFFALGRLHHGTHHAFIGREPDGTLAALGSVITRPGWLDGERIRTGYLCDLRIRPGFRGGATMARAMHDILAWVREETGADVFNTVIFDDNTRALATLTGAAAERRGQPRYHPMTPFQMISVQFTRRKRGPRGRVEAATAADVPALSAFLTEQGKQRVLGEDFSDGLLEKRLADWPGFSIGDFLIARTRGGEIVGCLAPWDTEAVKRSRILGYHGQMLWVKRVFNLGSRLLRYPPLPPEGECFRFSFLTHLEVRDDDPDVLNDLLRAAYQRLLPTRRHFMSAFVPRGSAREAAFKGFMVQHTAMTLYAVVPRDSAFVGRDWKTLHPGFEMALS